MQSVSEDHTQDKAALVRPGKGVYQFAGVPCTRMRLYGSLRCASTGLHQRDVLSTP